MSDIVVEHEIQELARKFSKYGSDPEWTAVELRVFSNWLVEYTTKQIEQ